MNARRPVHAGTYDGGVFTMTFLRNREGTKVETEQTGGACFPAKCLCHMRIGGNMLDSRFMTRGDHRILRDKLGNVPRLQGAVARRPAREAMRLVLLVLLATAAFG